MTAGIEGAANLVAWPPTEACSRNLPDALCSFSFLGFAVSCGQFV